MLGVDDLIDYSAKRGKDIYNQGCEALNDKALTNGFNMTPNKTVIFIEALERKADSMGWSKGTKQITKFTNRDGVDIDIIKNYGQIDMATLKTACARFCKAKQQDDEHVPRKLTFIGSEGTTTHLQEQVNIQRR